LKEPVGTRPRGRGEEIRKKAIGRFASAGQASPQQRKPSYTQKMKKLPTKKRGGPEEAKTFLREREPNRKRTRFPAYIPAQDPEKPSDMSLYEKKKEVLVPKRRKKEISVWKKS